MIVHVCYLQNKTIIKRFWSINYKIKLKQSELKGYAKKILNFARFLSKIRGVEIDKSVG